MNKAFYITKSQRSEFENSHVDDGNFLFFTEENANGYPRFVAKNSDGSIVEIGYHETQTIRETSGRNIVPLEHAIYRHVLQENDSITIDPNFHYDENNKDKCVTFELWLDMPPIPVSFIFPFELVWVSKFAPDFSVGNKRYVITIRWSGINYLANLAYTENLV